MIEIPGAKTEGILENRIALWGGELYLLSVDIMLITLTQLSREKVLFYRRDVSIFSF